MPQTPPPVDQGVPLPAARLRTLLADTARKLTADRTVARPLDEFRLGTDLDRKAVRTRHDASAGQVSEVR